MLTVRLQDDILIIDIDDEIHQWWGVSFKEIKDGIIYYKGKFTKVKVFINSPGGSVTDGMAIRNEILRLVEEGFDVDIEVIGLAASIASVIALAGTSLKLRTGSYLMIHRPYTVAVVDWEEAYNIASNLKKIYDDLIEIYDSSSNLEVEQIKTYVDAETWFTAKEAVQYGFASKITLPEKGEIVNNSSRVINGSGMIWSSFMNIPENLHSAVNKRVHDNNNINNKEIPMNLDEAIAANPGIEAEVNNRVTAAIQANGAGSGATENARILSLLNLSNGQITDLTMEGIKNGWSEQDLALAMVKGSQPQPQQQQQQQLQNQFQQSVPQQPVNQFQQQSQAQNPGYIVNNTAVIPPVTPSALDEKEVKAAQEEKKFDNLMENLFQQF